MWCCQLWKNIYVIVCSLLSFSSTIILIIYTIQAFSWINSPILPETVTLPSATAKTKKHSAKALPSVTLGKQHTTSTVSANSYLPSIFLSRTRQMVYRVSNLTLGKKVVCRVFLGITLGKGLLFAKYFWKLHSANLFSKGKKNNFFLSIPLLFAECFWELHSANLFSKEFFFLSIFQFNILINQHDIQVDQVLM